MALRHFCILHVLILLTLLAGQQAAGSKNYDKLCENIVKHGKLAAVMQNQGDEKKSQHHAKLAEKFFTEASSMAPKEPQAYVNWAVFLSNSKQYEKSLEMFIEALMFVGNDNEAAAQIEAAMKRTKYEFFSMKRDLAYRNATGNVSEAHYWGIKQLALTPNPHFIAHQIATMETMLCENRVEYCELAARRFQMAQEASRGRYALTFMPEDPKARLDCTHSRLYSGLWSPHQQVQVFRVPNITGLFVHVVDTPVILDGGDGVVTFPSDNDCSILSPSSDYYLDVAENVGRRTRRDDFQAIMNEPAISLVQFAGTSFYHWIAEALPRLVVARKHFKLFEKYPRIIVPAFNPSGTIPKFIVDTFQDLFAGWELTTALTPYIPGLRVQGGIAFVSWDLQQCPPHPRTKTKRKEEKRGNGETATDTQAPEDVDSAGSSLQCASLAHPDALRMAREAIHEVLDEKSAKKMRALRAKRDPYVLIATRGTGTSMRKYNEKDFIKKVTNLIQSAAGITVRFGLRVFSEASTISEALQTFRDAAVVIGVHGGALGNIVACENGTSVIEVGFNVPAAQHFNHMSHALGLRYYRVRVHSDPLNRGMSAPEISFDTNEVLSVLYDILREPATVKNRGNIKEPLSSEDLDMEEQISDEL